MENRKYTLEGLKDSRILYEKRVPRFGYGIILIVMALLIIIAIWMFNAKKTFVVKGVGVVESDNKNYIMAPYSGKIKKIYIKEGANISKGDVVATIKNTESELQKEQDNMQRKQLQVNKNNLEKQIEFNERMIQSVQKGANYFSSSNPEERYYYNKYEVYVNQRHQYSKDKKEGDARKDELYHQTLSEVGSTINNYELQLKDVNVQLKAYKKIGKPLIIKAQTNGIIHMVDSYKEGMEVQAGAVIASVSAQNEKYIVRAKISAADRARIKMNDTVDMEIAGLAQSVYGTIKGKIVSIDSDITIEQDRSVNNESGGYFYISVLPEKNYLVSGEGDIVNLRSGLEVETRIIYDKMNYMSYIAEALGVKAE